MSDPASPVSSARPPWLSPWWFLGGLVLGLVALAVVGRRVARMDYHPGYVRFFPQSSPETSYFPTLHEMTAIVRGECRPDQVLVIVGGNSILQGVWQPIEEVWSKHLQDLLGDHYRVVNLAFRGAGPANGGAVVAEVLRDEFPRQIYIANEAPLTAVESLGYDPYRYLTWEAYFGGRLIDFAPRKQVIAEYRATPAGRRVLIDAAIRSLFDRVLYFGDTWNWITFRHLCTVPSLYGAAIPELLTPRAEIPDKESDATDPDIVAQRYAASVLDIETQIVRGFEAYMHPAANGHWDLAEATRTDLLQHFAAAFPDSLKRRTLMLISRSSPYYVHRLSPAEQAGYDEAFRDTVGLWRESGYDAMEYGRDFNDDDFGDRTHLSKLGGAKLAAAVAPEVRALAGRLGYLR